MSGGKCALVTGAPGFVGSHLTRELLKQGYHVRALHRPSSDLADLKGLDIDLVEGDITDKSSMLRTTRGVDYVFHIAALFRQAKFPDQVYYEVNVAGTRNVLDAAIENDVKRFIHCSTVGVHSHIPDPPADESEPYRPGDVYQSSKCEGEKLVLRYFAEGRIRGVVIRPAMVWGPADRRMLKLFSGIAHRRLPLIGSGRTLLHWVDVRDLARAFRLAAEARDVSNEVFIIAGRHPVTIRTLYETIASVYNAKPLPFRVPAAPLQILGDLVEMVCIPLGIEPPIYRRRVDFYTKTRAFDWSKAKRLLGYSPRNRLEEEVRDIAESYRIKGWIEKDIE